MRKPEVLELVGGDRALVKVKRRSVTGARSKSIPRASPYFHTNSRSPMRIAEDHPPYGIRHEGLTTLPGCHGR